MAFIVSHEADATHIVNCVDDAFFIRATSDEDAIAFCEKAHPFAQSLFEIHEGMDGEAIWAQEIKEATL